MSNQVAPAPMSPEEEHLWRGLIRLLVKLPREIDNGLVRDAGISLSRYVVLMRLSEAPGQQLRLSDLATAASLSPSRLTRIAQSMARQGLLARETMPGDARATAVRLTETGLERLRQAWPAHLAGVRALVLDHVEPDELASLDQVVHRLVEALDRSGEPGRPVEVDQQACPA